MSTTRRIYFYLVTLVALGIFTSGVGQLLTLLFDMTIKSGYLAQTQRVVFDRQLFSLGLAMIAIAGPLWFFFWRSIQRRVTGNGEETGASMRKFFLNLVLVGTAITAISTASEFLKWLMAGARLPNFSSGTVAIFIVTVLIWFYHYRVSETEGYPLPPARTFRRWYVYILSGFGLVWLSVGVVQLISSAVLVLPVWGDTLVRGQFWNDSSRNGITFILLGGAAWYFHWFRMAKGDFESTLRQVYFYVLAISGGFIAALVALTTTLYRILVWLFGGVTVSAGRHFQFIGWTIVTLVVGIAIWVFHRQVAEEEEIRSQERHISAQRVHVYLMSFIGLTTLVAGLIILFGILITLINSAITPPVAAGTGSWQDPLSMCIALLLVGTPLWLYYWGKILRRVETGNVNERRARSRRIYLYVVVGASVIALAADLVNIVYQILIGILQGDIGTRFLRESRWSWQTLIVAVPLLWYHWQIIRTDQKRGAEAVVTQKKVTLLTSDRSGELADRIGKRLGYKIRVLYTAGETASVSDEELARLANEVEGSPEKNVMLLVTGDRILALPYQEK
ncbi:MAG: DUF5671 domain-containing protein [Dehalococcoidia bacterium]|nr:DUF5671 domain-containing protein [Dehalococcoidia bacterium]